MVQGYSRMETMERYVSTQDEQKFALVGVVGIFRENQ